MDNPLHATIEEFAADGYTHIECYCPRCRVTRLRPINSRNYQSGSAVRSAVKGVGLEG